MHDRRRILRVEPLVLELGAAHREEELVVRYCPALVGGRVQVARGGLAQRHVREAGDGGGLLLAVAHTGRFAANQLVPRGRSLAFPPQHLVASEVEVVPVLFRLAAAREEMPRALVELEVGGIGDAAAYWHLKGRSLRGAHDANKL